jgi:hypothetical protein
VTSDPSAGGAVAEPVRVRRLTDPEGQKLQQTVRRGSTNSVRYRRAMMLLASAGGTLGRTPPRHRGLTNREQQPPNADGASSGEGQRQKDDSGGERLDLPREDDDLVDEAPSQMDDIRSRQAGASIRRGEDPLVPGPFVRHVHR